MRNLWKARMRNLIAAVGITLLATSALVAAQQHRAKPTVDAKADQALNNALALCARERARHDRYEGEWLSEKLEATLPALRAVIARYPGTTASLSARVLLAGILINEPQVNVDEAPQIAESVVEDAPDSWQAGTALTLILYHHERRGRFELQREHPRLDVAAEHLRRGIAAGEKALRLLGKPIPAAERRIAAKIGPGGPQDLIPGVRLDIGLCARNLGDYARARREWEVIVSKYTGTHNVHLAKKYLFELPQPPKPTR